MEVDFQPFSRLAEIGVADFEVAAGVCGPISPVSSFANMPGM